MVVTVLRCGSPQGSPGCPCSISCSPPRWEAWGRQAAEAEAGDALHPTLITSCSEPRRTQQRLLVPPGPAPGLSLKVLPAQGHAVPALPRPLSSLQFSFPAPAPFLPEAGGLSPSGHGHGSACLVLTTGGEVQEKKKEKIKEVVWGFFLLWAENRPFYLPYVRVKILRLSLFRSEVLMVGGVYTCMVG